MWHSIKTFGNAAVWQLCRGRKFKKVRLGVLFLFFLCKKLRNEAYPIIFINFWTMSFLVFQMSSRGVVVGYRNLGKFLKKFFEKQWQKVDFWNLSYFFSHFYKKKYQNQWQKRQFWNLSEFFQWLLKNSWRSKKPRRPPPAYQSLPIAKLVGLNHYQPYP